jgi:hypothetical protein
LERDVAIEFVCGLIISRCRDRLSAQSRPEQQGDLGALSRETSHPFVPIREIRVTPSVPPIGANPRNLRQNSSQKNHVKSPGECNFQNPRVIIPA